MQQQMIDGGESPAVQRGLQFQKKLPCCFKPLSQTCGWAHFCSRGPESLQIVLTFCEKLHLSGRDLCYLMGKSPLIFFFNLLQQLLLKLKRPFNALKHHRWPVIIQWIIFYAFMLTHSLRYWGMNQTSGLIECNHCILGILKYFAGEGIR